MQKPTVCAYRETGAVEKAYEVQKIPLTAKIQNRCSQGSGRQFTVIGGSNEHGRQAQGSQGSQDTREKIMRPIASSTLWRRVNRGVGLGLKSSDAQDGANRIFGAREKLLRKK